MDIIIILLIILTIILIVHTLSCAIFMSKKRIILNIVIGCTIMIIAQLLVIIVNKQPYIVLEHYNEQNVKEISNYIFKTPTTIEITISRRKYCFIKHKKRVIICNQQDYGK